MTVTDPGAVEVKDFGLHQGKTNGVPWSDYVSRVRWTCPKCCEVMDFESRVPQELALASGAPVQFRYNEDRAAVRLVAQQHACGADDVPARPGSSSLPSGWRKCQDPKWIACESCAAEWHVASLPLPQDVRNRHGQGRCERTPALPSPYVRPGSNTGAFMYHWVSEACERLLKKDPRSGYGRDELFARVDALLAVEERLRTVTRDRDWAEKKLVEAASASGVKAMCDGREQGPGLAAVREKRPDTSVAFLDEDLLCDDA